MSEGEKKIWAAVFAEQWCKRKMSVSMCVSLANLAISELRDFIRFPEKHLSVRDELVSVREMCDGE